MTEQPQQDADDEMAKAAAVREQRNASRKRAGKAPLWRHLSMIGALGWLIIAPTLLGIVLGRWLDVQFGSGIFWSGALIMLGSGFGGYLAWQRMTRE